MNEEINWNPDLLKFKDTLRTLAEGDQKYIFCRLRKSWLALQPEEMVRQLVVNYLIDDVKIREKSIQIEKNIKKHSSDRVDLAVYSKGSQPFLLIECKTWDAELNRNAINQISRYNLDYKFANCWVTNGKSNIMYNCNQIKKEYNRLNGFPMGYN